MILSLRNKQLRKEHTDRELARVLTDLINVLVPWVVLQASPHSNSSFHPKIKKITSLYRELCIFELNETKLPSMACAKWQTKTA